MWWKTEKRGKNDRNLNLCRSANLELVANLLGSQSIWGNQMGGPEIRILERDRPNLDQISWRKICKIHPQKLFCVKKSYKQKTSVPWFDQWVSSSTEGLGLIQYLDEVTIEKSRKNQDKSTIRMNPEIKGCEVDPVNRINYWAAFARFCQSTNAHLAHQSILII